MDVLYLFAKDKTEQATLINTYKCNLEVRIMVCCRHTTGNNGRNWTTFR